MNTRNIASDDKGVVYKKTIGTYFVHPLSIPGQAILCAISNRLRKELIYPIAAPSSLPHRVRQVKDLDHSDPIAIGDRVRFRHTGDGTGLITEILPRRNQLARRNAGSGPFEQVIAANIDQVVPVFSAAAPAPHWNMLDRYLVSAESYQLPTLVVITKIDLAGSSNSKVDQEIQAAVAEYRQIGYPVLCVSVVTGEGIAELREALRNRISVFVGKSGVGKTSLLNALQPDLGLRVKAISDATGKGRHTTTWFELFPLDFGGGILDTPGVREFGLWDTELDDLGLLFPEIRPWIGKCRFRLDCQHDDEPGCAVRRAVMAGEISPRRYQSYLRLREDWSER